MSRGGQPVEGAYENCYEVPQPDAWASSSASHWEFMSSPFIDRGLRTPLDHARPEPLPRASGNTETDLWNSQWHDANSQSGTAVNYTLSPSHGFHRYHSPLDNGLNCTIGPQESGTEQSFGNLINDSDVPSSSSDPSGAAQSHTEDANALEESESFRCLTCNIELWDSFNTG